MALAAHKKRGTPCKKVAPRVQQISTLASNSIQSLALNLLIY